MRYTIQESTRKDKKKQYKGVKNMSVLKEKLMSINHNLIEETIAIAPTYQTAELIKEYDPAVETIMTETLRKIIKDIKEEKPQ